MQTSSALIDAFCDQVWLQDGLAASSLASYRRDLVAWARWLENEGPKPGKSLLAAKRGDIEAFLAAQFKTRAKSSSINRRLSSLRRFYRLQVLLGALKDDPTSRVQAPKLPRHLPKNLSEAQIVALLDAPDTETTLGLRDRAMLETLYATGLRVSELVGLTLAQVSLDMGVVRVVGKGNKERLVPMGEEAIGWIKRYLATARGELAGTGRSDALFLTGRSGTLEPPGILAADQALRNQGRHRPRGVVAAYAEARIRDPPSESRRRFAGRAAAPRSRGHHDHDHLYARGARAIEAAASAPSSPRLTRG